MLLDKPATSASFGRESYSTVRMGSVNFDLLKTQNFSLFWDYCLEWVMGEEIFSAKCNGHLGGLKQRLLRFASSPFPPALLLPDGTFKGPFTLTQSSRLVGQTWSVSSPLSSPVKTPWVRWPTPEENKLINEFTLWGPDGWRQFIFLTLLKLWFVFFCSCCLEE